MSRQYRFRIAAYTPATIPMAKLAGYLEDLAAMLGSEENVHFLDVEEGSTVLVCNVDQAAVPSVTHNISNATRAIGRSNPARRAFRKLNRRLAADAASAVLTEDTRTVVRFPGKEYEESTTIPGFWQEGYLDGICIGVLGTQDAVSIRLLATVDDSVTYRCRAPISTAHEILPHWRKSTLRVHGRGRWILDEDDETWRVERFDIERFEVLGDAPLSALVNELREAHRNSDWYESDRDNILELLEARSDE